MLDWSLLIAVVAAGVAAITLIDRLTGGRLTRNEHNEFKESVKQQFENLNSRLDHIETRINGHWGLERQTPPNH